MRSTDRPSADGRVLALREGDHVRVRIWPDEGLGGDFPVEENGEVYLPLIGVVRFAGRSLQEVREELRSRYRREMKDPIVIVTPVFRVSVLGQVVRPGLYNVEGWMGLMDVIALAGGFRPGAELEHIEVVREGQVLDLDAKEALRTGEIRDLVTLRSGDNIIVGTRARGWMTSSNLRLLLQTAILGITLVNLMQR